MSSSTITHFNILFSTITFLEVKILLFLPVYVWFIFNIMGLAYFSLDKKVSDEKKNVRMSFVNTPHVLMNCNKQV